MSQPAVILLTPAQMLMRIGDSFDAETRAKVLHGETSLRTSDGVFACEKRPRTTTTTDAPTSHHRDGYLGVVTI
jgi:hypothetical protein